ncbi:uncharacterized protein TNCV_4068281 [Trichonephila clavipes]|nr:uncharacterized protein TNCV_4068281 [Trichonephila clavipes]
MDPTEHVWDALGRRVAGHQPPPTNSPRTGKSSSGRVGQNTQLVINSLIDSMPQRSFRSKSPKKMPSRGETQNCNESLNNVMWSIFPKVTYVELQTLRLEIYIAIILFNFGFAGLLPQFQKLGMELCSEMKGYSWYLDNTRIVDSTRPSKPD